MTSGIDSIINPDYLVLPLSIAEHNHPSLLLCYRLQEDDPRTKNKQINILSSKEHKITVFKSDYSNSSYSSNHQVSPLYILNHYQSGLTRVPDFILFYETQSIVYAIIIELKSHYVSKLQGKFNNGGRIARFIHSFYDTKLPLQIVNLLFHLPEQTTKKPVYYKNYTPIKSEDYGYACNQHQVYFDELIRGMHLRTE